MLRRTLLALSAGVLALTFSVGAVFAGNPSGTGQPNASCGSADATSEPPGFLTSGFANAESVYAGSDGTPSLANAMSDNAVSQYDVACYQITQH